MSERIIIAEDDEDLAFVLREALRRQRYDVEVAPTAGGLLDGLKASQYDLALLDVRLPDMDGLDAIPRCRELAPDTPIIVMRVVDMAHRAAPTDLTILVQGESGTGKEVLARAIHRLSVRKDGPFVPVNCAAIPEGLLESELFGHERGAFTGAVRARPGRFELAKEGTLFLDEIGDMPLSMQAKILRVLQEREFERVGGTRTMTADVRVIAATHRDLDAAVAQGTFRQDLFYRLQGVGIVLPPLRERVDDLPLLATHMLERAAQRLTRQPAVLSPEALRCLWTYSWPGNVRELQHVLEGAMVLSDGVIRPDHLPPAIQRAAEARPAGEAGPVLAGSLDEALEEWERRMILDALQRTQGVQARAAKILGVSERSLWYRIKKLGIQVRTPDDAPSA
jgi:two-component system response regulator HydG